MLGIKGLDDSVTVMSITRIFKMMALLDHSVLVIASVEDVLYLYQQMSCNFNGGKDEL